MKKNLKNIKVSEELHEYLKIKSFTEKKTITELMDSIFKKELEKKKDK